MYGVSGYVPGISWVAQVPLDEVTGRASTSPPPREVTGSAGASPPLCEVTGSTIPKLTAVTGVPLSCHTNNLHEGSGCTAPVKGGNFLLCGGLTRASKFLLGWSH